MLGKAAANVGVRDFCAHIGLWPALGNVGAAPAEACRSLPRASRLAIEGPAVRPADLRSGEEEVLWVLSAGRRSPGALL